MYSVLDHKLVSAYPTRTPPDVAQYIAQNRGKALIAPEFLVLHYTGGLNFDNAVMWLSAKRPAATASSAHVVIGFDRYPQTSSVRVAQLLPFDVIAYHAGQSEYRVGDYKFTGLNQHSIGIELVNPGPLRKHADGHWYTLDGKHQYKPQDVVLGFHKHTKWKYEGWAVYPKQQIDALIDIGAAIIEAYPTIKHVVGHDDIAPGRKMDPGPALDMHTIEARLLGRA